MGKKRSRKPPYETAQKPVTAEEAVSLAVDLHRRGHLSAAQALYAKILEQCPDHADALHFSGLLAYHLGKVEDAIERMTRAVAVRPDYADAHNNLGNLFQEQGRLDEAEARYRRVVALCPVQADALNNLGTVLKRKGDVAAAACCFEQAIAHDPGHAGAHFNLANVHALRRDWADAEHAYRRAVACRRDFAAAYSELGHVLKRQGRHGEAVDAYRTAVGLQKDSADSLLGLGNALFQLGKFEEAAAAYRRAVAVREDCFEAYENLANAHLRLGQLPRAAEVCRAWLSHQPDSPVAAHMLASFSGEGIPDRASDGYIEGIFDNFARSFDEKLKALDYRAPELVGEAAARAARGHGGGLAILDAGCGTGLCAPYLKPLGRLVGVDLSQSMLERAEDTGLYDALERAELTAYLEAHASAFDLVVSADTLVYFGRLDGVLGAVRGALKAGGHLVATLERAADGAGPDGFVLNPHGRYSHTGDYVRGALIGAGLTPVTLCEVILRQEGGMPVAGWLILARRA